MEEVFDTDDTEQKDKNLENTAHEEIENLSSEARLAALMMKQLEIKDRLIQYVGNELTDVDRRTIDLGLEAPQKILEAAGDTNSPQYRAKLIEATVHLEELVKIIEDFWEQGVEPKLASEQDQEQGKGMLGRGTIDRKASRDDMMQRLYYTIGKLHDAVEKIQ